MSGTCPHEPCTCPTPEGRKHCSDHCEKEARDGRLQRGPCHCGHDGCGGSRRGPEGDPIERARDKE